MNPALPGVAYAVHACNAADKLLHGVGSRFLASFKVPIYFALVHCESLKLIQDHLTICDLRKQSTVVGL
jgi:hypothetical protein